MHIITRERKKEERQYYLEKVNSRKAQEKLFSVEEEWIKNVVGPREFVGVVFSNNLHY